MNDVVPGALQRLREADIVGLAGLASASLGQEYCRLGYVSATRRRGAHLSGIVTLPEESSEHEIDQANVEQPEEGNPPGTASPVVRPFAVEVDLLSSDACQVVCSCGKEAGLICTHAAALLYQWIARPQTFLAPVLVSEESNGATPTTETLLAILAAPKPIPAQPETPARPPVRPAPAGSSYAPLPLRRQAVNTVEETLAQFGLSELRSVAREYGIGLTGLGKQQLIETLIETLSQPEAIRRVVGALEKPARQLLAAFALAGGSMSDEDLRGLCERFSLGTGGALQEMLLALQAKLLIVRTSFNHSLQQRFNLSVAPLDLSWYIPQEVREALHVTLPITPFNVEVPYGKGANPALPTLQLVEHSTLLADLLLIARALDGFPVEVAEKRGQRGSTMYPGTRLPADGSLALPAPTDQPAPAMVETLQTVLKRSPAFLRFAVRLLRLNDLLAQEDRRQANLRALPNAPQLLLGPARDDTLHDLFTHWLSQPSYAELYELVESGMRVRCRATPLNQPDLRRGELEQENSEARQDVLALLAQVPLGEWINFSAFARFVYRLRPTFLQRRQRLFPSPHWWIEEEEGRPLHPTKLADWLRAEGRYLAHLIQMPLHWWGLCDVALSNKEQLLAFRLTPLARFLFQGRSPGAQTEHIDVGTQLPALTVSPAGQLLITCAPANWPLIACVEAFAESKGVQDEKLRYALTAHSLGAALNQGRDPRALHDLLASFSKPEEDAGDALRQLLARLEQRIAQYGRVRLYTDVPLLQAADISVVQQITAITSLDRQIVRSLQPTLFLLKKQGAEQILDELRRRGQTPLLYGEE